MISGDILAAEVAKLGGRVTPDDVVKAARRKTSPLHPYFDWSDTEAAVHWRRQQARQLIARVKVTFEEVGSNRPIRVRAYASVIGDDGERAYAHVNEIRESDELTEQVLNDIRTSLASVKYRYRSYGHLFRAALIELLDESAA